ncbi:hypothetical protein [Inediibacterium massiliense]|uniref:hypothetical protein n=1 Tax=Inediibacterium massiliense TaxID=1658111 RepID=UPI0006B602CA|nr:hypothetical protein [Inediibacterium massiliense]
MKRIFIFAAVVICLLLLYPKLSQSNQMDKPSPMPQIHNKNFEGYILSTSPSGYNKIICTSNNQLLLMARNNSDVALKEIYENYSELSTDPYSVYNFEDYLIQWSENEKYIFIKDSIYDVDNDKLIPIKDNIIFSWIGNKGMYIADGYYYTMGYGESDFNYMAIGKQIKVFDKGNITTLCQLKDDRYFMLDNVYMGNMFKITDHYLIIDTVSLKHDAKELQEIIYNNYSKMLNSIYKRKNIKPYDDPEYAQYIHGKYYLKNIQSNKFAINFYTVDNQEKSSIFENKEGKYKGTVSGILFLQRGEMNTKEKVFIILDFQGGNAVLNVEKDLDEIYDLCSENYIGFTTSGKSVVRYSTYATANGLTIEVGKDKYRITTIDGACEEKIEGVESKYWTENNVEYLTLKFPKEVRMYGLDNNLITYKRYAKILPDSFLVFCIKNSTK